MSIEQINNKAPVPVKKNTAEAWTRQNMPLLNASNASERLLTMTQSQGQRDIFLMQFLQHAVSITNAMGAVYFYPAKNQQLVVGPQLLSKELMSASPDLVGKVAEHAKKNAQTGLADTFELNEFVCTVVPVRQPLQSNQVSAEVLVAIYRIKDKNNHQLLNNQLLSAYVHLWRIHQDNKQLNTESFFSSALLELITVLQQSHSKSDFDSLLVNQLHDVLACDKVAFGRYVEQGDRCDLSAISGISDIDKRTNLKSLIELCSFEAKQFGKTIDLSNQAVDKKNDDRSLFVSHQRLLDKVDAQYIVSIILTDEEENLVGSLIFWWSKIPKDIHLKKQFIEASKEPLATSIRFSSEKRTRLFQSNKKSFWFRYKKIFFFGVLCILLSMVFIPVEHKVVAKLSLEPVFQRIISTRYDGVLKEILVEPGQKIQQGETLALLDDQDLLLRQQSLQAEYDGAVKDKNLKIAASKISEFQIANLEVQRLSLEIQLLKDQLSDLSITAPISGLVISESIDRRQGSLVKKGEVLFEVAPLEKMYAELAIPAEDISYVEKGVPLQIQLDALPNQRWQAALENIQPRSLVVDSENVFITKVPLDNDAAFTLKPGMQGTASLSVGKRSLGWVLLHKAMNRVQRWFLMTFTSPT